MCQTTNLLPVATTVLLPRFTLCVALHQRSSVHLHGIARLRVLRQLQNEIWLLQEMERIDTPRGIDPVHARQRWWQHDNHQRRRTTPTSTSHDGASTCGSTTVCRGQQQPQMLMVTVPQGVMVGQMITVQTPTGQQLQVQVPQGVFPGQQFQVQY
jgi:hypothetical protein